MLSVRSPFGQLQIEDLFALSIPQAGEETANDIANHFKDIKKIQSAPFEELERIDGIGPVVAKSVRDWFDNPRNRHNLENLLKLVKIKKVEVSTSGMSGFVGKTFVLTGTLKSMTRDEVKEIIRKNGGEISSSVSSQTDYVVIGENPGSKFYKAKELNVKILTESEFMKILE